MKKIIFGAILLFIFVPSVSAQYVSPGSPYSAAQAPTNQLLINKMLLNPQTNQFVDNLSVDQFLFMPGQEVTFRIIVTNNSQTTLNNIKVTDTLPSQLQFSSGPLVFDSINNNYYFMINSLDPGQAQSVDYKTKVKSADQIPNNVFCMSNLAQASVNSMVEQDTANLCVSKQVLGNVQTLPKTGPKETVEVLLGSFFLIGLSLIILGINKNLRGGE